MKSRDESEAQYRVWSRIGGTGLSGWHHTDYNWLGFGHRVRSHGRWFQNFLCLDGRSIGVGYNSFSTGVSDLWSTIAILISRSLLTLVEGSA